MSRARFAGAAACAGLSVLALAGWGTVRPRESPAYSHPTLLDGTGWTELSLREKELLVQGFVMGAAAEQALAVRAAGAGRSPEAAAPTGPAEAARNARDVAGEIARLREERGLRFSYGPGLLARRLDEFYWWRNNRNVPVTGALAEIARRLRTENF